MRIFESRASVVRSNKYQIRPNIVRRSSLRSTQAMNAKFKLRESGAQPHIKQISVFNDQETTASSSGSTTSLPNERELLSLIMDYSPDSIFIKDADGRYLRTNRADA